MIDASITRSPAKPRTRQPLVNHRLVVLAHAAGADRVIDGRAAAADVIENLAVAGAGRTGLGFFGDVLSPSRALR